MVNDFQAKVVDSLNNQDAASRELLNQTVAASENAGAAGTDIAAGGDLKAQLDTDGIDGVSAKEANDKGYIMVDGVPAAISGTGGVALLEYAKEEITTVVSNVSSVGTLDATNRKTAARKTEGIAS